MALGRKSWFFCGSDGGGKRDAFTHMPVEVAKLNENEAEVSLARFSPLRAEGVGASPSRALGRTLFVTADWRPGGRKRPLVVLRPGPPCDRTPALGGRP